MEIHAVIMAGGSGTRLWPISRQNKPKQYIALGQDKCMLVQTLERLYTFMPPDKCHIITNCDQKEILTEALDSLTVSSVDFLADTATKDFFMPEIIYEPLGKNTAACITYSALLLKKQAGNCLICFIPADSLIDDTAAYRTTLEAAFRAAETGIGTDGGVIIVGITPSYPATGYGYIKPCSVSAGGPEVQQVEHFLEKPDVGRANELYSSGEYLWNSGIVIGQADSILDKVQLHLPKHYSRLYDAVYNGGDLAQAYEAVENVSFDNGVLEKCKDIHVIKASFGWNDIGSVDALDKIHRRDPEGNTVVGCYLGMDVNDSVIYSKEGLVTAMGIQNMIIVNTVDVMLVCPRDRVQDIKKLVALLKSNGFDRYI